jgi:hypothetical protein
VSKLKNCNLSVVFLAVTIIGNLVFAPLSNIIAAEGNLPKFSEAKMVAELDFDPKVNGFGFENFGNKQRNWQDDLGAEDMIRLFGVKAVCKVGNTPQNCVMKAAAREWMMKQLEGMDGGHCEGLAATSLRFMLGKEFKSKVRPSDFQPGATVPFKLKLNQPVENYIAYYFVTQNFDEVYEPTNGLTQKGPLAVVKKLIDSMNAGGETYTLGIYNVKKGQKVDGHAITPIAVEDAGGAFRIHVYDNNYPGETRHITVDKAGKQTWKYVTSTNPDEQEQNYIGDVTTETLELTASSARDRNGKFKAPFDESGSSDTEEVVEEPKKPIAKPVPDDEEEKPAPVKPTPAKPNENNREMLEFALLGEGEMLITAPDGKRVGFDFKQNRRVNEIAGAKITDVKGGLSRDLTPIYRLPVAGSNKPYTVTVSGKSLKRETAADFTFSGRGFTVGLDEILLDPGEVLSFTVSPDGGEISYTASNDGETPEIYFATDTKDGFSFFVELIEDILEAVSSKNNEPNRVQFVNAKFGGKNEKAPAPNAGTTLTAKFDRKTGKLAFRDSDGDDDVYDIDVKRISPNGTEQNYETNNIEADAKNNSEADFGSGWNGKDAVCVKEDDEGNGFADEKCEPQPNEDNDADVKGDRDDDGDTDDDGIYDNLDNDDDNDGIPDKADKDDDGDGTPDVEDEDVADLDADGLADGEDDDDDGDGVSDEKDDDDDNDGISDEEDDDGDEGEDDDGEDDGDNDTVMSSLLRSVETRRFFVLISKL